MEYSIRSLRIIKAWSISLLKRS